MGRNEDERDLHADLGQLVLKIEAAHLRQPYIENQATRVSGSLPFQKLFAR